ncbi:uncharacterized protein EMH_0044520 [Eimeria mitis]|uniref:Uncharacterized protein n=1 Tax=Eimeria mitis TaxID=44415 RepID=U6JXU8_9EIME|nr:uncharacterized protein EMH_0044520 [Eimeria mitis]CDJ28847.1 hypothetical protein EMH_0044520 [Eimeria mitis]
MGSAADTLDAGALDPAYSDLVFGGGEEQQHLSQLDKAPGLQQEASDSSAVPLEYYQASAAAGQTGFFSVGDAYSGDAALTPEAWLDDSVANMYPQTSQQMAVSTVWGNPVVEDLTAFSDAGSVASSSEGAGRFGPRTAGAEAGKGISAAEALDASVWDPVDSGLVFGGDEEQQHLSQLGKAPKLQQEASGFSTRPLDYYEASAAAGQPDSSSGGSAYSSDAALSPEGWLDESVANMYPQTSQQMAVSTVWGTPVVEDLTAFSGAGSVGTSSEGAGIFGPRAADSGLVFGGDEEQQHLSQLGKAPKLQQEAWGFSTRPLDYYEASAAAGQTDSSSGGSAYSSDAALTPEGWLDESLSNVYPQTTQQMEVSTVWRNAVVETASTATIDAGSVGTSSEGAGKIGAKVAGTAAGKDRAVPTVQSKAAQRRKRRAQAAAADLDAVKGSASAPAVRATSRGRTGQAEEPDLRQHPFVRLPVVNPEDIHKSFRVEIALTPNLNISSPMDSYVMMRSLFGQSSLTAEEVDTLIKESELLTDYRLPEIARMQKTEDSNKLINKLSSALAIYKQQRRPEPKVIIDMKRTILNLPYKGTQFSHPLWRMWIQDDKDFFGSKDDSESSSDDEKPGHGETKEP